MNARPAVRQNDFSPLTPPELGAWSPSLSVSVVIPAHGGPYLEFALAALAAQTYPDHLMEVLVVDDSSRPAIELPEIRPFNTRIVRVTDGWGISNAVNTGALAADGEIIQRLDADMVPCREHIEALARWHHVTDYLVTIGMKRFVEPPPLKAEQIYRAGHLEELFDLDAAVASSTEATIAKTDGLRKSRNPYHVCTGPTLALPREIFHAVGGLDPNVHRGGDTEFAYRLAMHGVVFIPDEAAKAVHLGLPAQRVDKDRVVRAVEPAFSHRIPLRRDLRKDRGRRWLVPYVEIVFEVGDTPVGVVRQAVAAALDGKLQDVVVTLVAPWSTLRDERRSVLNDPSFDLRMMRDLFAYDDRIRLIDEAAPTPAPIPFRYRGPVDVPLHRATLERMVETVQKDLDGVLVVDVGAGRSARLERTSALARAVLLAGVSDDLDAVIEQTHGVRHADPARYWPPPPLPEAPPTAATPKPASAPEPVQISAVPAVPAEEKTLLNRLKSALRPN
ncbi:glycosyltransferase [Nonomuraea endophytica]|uniref:glycosyltransferase n=1 Tax=Nonomuraea endophytica TaxID=714136 RepID=UPI0037C9FE0D